ncbi:MAG: DUF4394 domain-containing protein [Elainellaceae cyanobacterium]
MVSTLGSSSSEALIGSNDNDLILGGAGDDTLSGLGGNDVLSGNGSVQFYALTGSNALVAFSSTDPTNVATTAITGVAGTLLGIDVRPADGMIYGVSTTGTIYTINPATGVATAVSVLSETFSADQVTGFDFNPVADRLRLVGDNEQDFRINVDTGDVTIDGDLAYDVGDANEGVDPTITAAAYTNSFDGTPATQLYDIDADLDVLVLQNPPNDGTLQTIGSLGVDFDTLGGFDILSAPNSTNLAFAVSNSTLYQIDLTTGAATSLGIIGDGSLTIQGVTSLFNIEVMGSNSLNGDGGNDVLIGGVDEDALSGGSGNDVLMGGFSGDTLRGNNGDDFLTGDRGNDVLNGGAGNDIAEGGRRKDTLRGRGGDDLLKGGVGKDSIRGNQGADVLLGGRGRDTIIGGGGNDFIEGDGTLQALALTDTNTLVSFDPNSPDQSQTISITGVSGTLLGIDIRPANGLVYGISSTNTIYTINTETGAATEISTLNQPFTSDTVSGFDFNPVADRLRLVGANDQDFRINVDTGEVTVDGSLTYATGDANEGADPSVTAAAYTNSFAGTTATQLYDIDAALDVLVLQNPPNDGILQTVGSLGVDFDNLGGLDILAASNGYNQAFALSDSALYTVDLSTGAATRVGQLAGKSDNFVGLTVSIVSDQASGRDTLSGGSGSDVINGGKGRDTLMGKSGRDTLTGGQGRDTLTGDKGADQFVFTADVEFSQARLGNDTITDFGTGNDLIVLDQTVFGSINSNQIRFVDTNSDAAGSRGAIVYSQSSGNLYFNENRAGNGFGDGGLFAQLSNAPTLTADDFLIVA